MKRITVFLTALITSLISQSDAKQIQEINQNNWDLTEIKNLVDLNQNSLISQINDCGFLYPDQDFDPVSGKSTCYHKPGKVFKMSSYNEHLQKNRLKISEVNDNVFTTKHRHLLWHYGIDKCFDINFSRESSNFPVNNHPKVNSVHICNPKKAVTIISIDTNEFNDSRSTTEALLILDPYKIADNKGYNGYANYSKGRNYQFSHFYPETPYCRDNLYSWTDDQGINKCLYWWKHDPSWAITLTKQLVEKQSNKRVDEIPYKKIGLEVSICDSECQKIQALNTERSGGFLPPTWEPSQKNLLIVTDVKKNSRAEGWGSPKNGFKVGDIITRLDDMYPYINNPSVNDLNRYIYNNQHTILSFYIWRPTTGSFRGESLRIHR